MRWYEPYDAVIFDCDGVILNSNFLKIKVMQTALEKLVQDDKQVAECIEYFSSNFGLSRFHHVDKFFDDIITNVKGDKSQLKMKLLELYSFGCELLYSTAEVTPNFWEFISGLDKDCFVASGSEQKNLRETFTFKGLSEYFREILGSPAAKVDNLNAIKAKYGCSNAILVGDSVQDYIAAEKAGIDFIAYTPFSADKSALIACCEKFSLQRIDEWVL